ncbi:MAG: hypothetical protein JXA25_03445 [Anaerolineales bacterium]|nr:hypothetical protein [Anaerolineales bacterium]
MPVRRRPGHQRPPFRRRAANNPRLERSLARLRYANRFMEAGHFIDAANIFNDLARKAEDRSIPRAPQLYIQAGRALTLAGEIDNGMLSLNKGLQLMLDHYQLQRFQVASYRVIQDLRKQGFENQALQLENTFAEYSKNRPTTPVKPQTQHPPLPPSCPDCGAVVRPEELEWINKNQAYCDYCGSVLERR